MLWVLVAACLCVVLLVALPRLVGRRDDAARFQRARAMTTSWSRPALGGPVPQPPNGVAGAPAGASPAAGSGDPDRPAGGPPGQPSAARDGRFSSPAT